MSVQALLWAHKLRVGLTPFQKLTLLVLAEHADDAGANAWPAVATIAAEAELSDRTVQRSLGELIQRGIVSAKRGGGRSNTTVYTLNMGEKGDRQTPNDGGKGVGQPPIQASNGVQQTPIAALKGVLQSSLNPVSTTPIDPERVSVRPKRVSATTLKGVPQSPEPVLNLSKNQEEEERPDGLSCARTRPDHFEDFWAAYPRKVGKGAARAAFDRARKRGATVAEIASGLCRQVWPKDRQFIPHPATWLNQGRWQDEPAEVQPQKSGGTFWAWDRLDAFTDQPLTHTAGRA